MSKPLAQRVTRLEAALRGIINEAPRAKPSEEDYTDKPSAYANGFDNGAWSAAQNAFAAIAAPAHASEREMVEVALEKLREARDLLAAANAPRALERVRAALKSAEGAGRNADYRTVRHTRADLSSSAVL